MKFIESDSDESMFQYEVESEAEVIDILSEEVVETVPPLEGIKKRSWVYEYSEKLEKSGKSFFCCRVELRDGKQCTYKEQSNGGNTTNISNHLKSRHKLKPPKLQVQTTLDHFENMPQKPKSKSFRESFAELVTKQYLPFSLIEEKVLQDAFITFYNEWAKTKTQPAFVTDKTIAADIAKMADAYVAEMKTRFQSKLSDRP